MLKALKTLPPMLLILILASLPHLIYILTKWHAVPLDGTTPIGTPDPDPWLRLTLVREWIINGDWYNHLVPRSNTPFDPTITPWTRPLDVVIAAITYLQPDSVDLSIRLVRTALLLPWIWMTLLALGLYRLAALTPTPPSTFLMVSFLLAATPTIWNYFGLANADHHAPLAVIFIWAMHSVLQENPKPRATIISGFLFGLQLWISVEALILIGGVYAWYGLLWLRGDSQEAKPLFLLSLSTALATTLGLIAERPSSEWFTPIYDTISIVHVVTLSIAAITAACLQLHQPQTFLKRTGFAAITTVLALAFLYATYPLLFAGPMVESTAYIFQNFLPNISEAQPAYQARTGLLLATYIIPLTAIALCVAALHSSRRALYAEQHATKLLFFLILTFVLYNAQQRWSYYLLPLAIATVAPALGALFTPTHPTVRTRWPANWLARLPENEQAKRRLPILVLLAGLPMALMYFSATPIFPTSKNEEQLRIQQRDSCYKSSRVLLTNGALDSIDGNTALTLFAPTDLGAEILFWTNHHIVASNYHREGDGIEYIWEAPKITDTKQLRTYFAQRKIDALLLCPNLARRDGSVLQNITAGATPPTWLKPISYNHPATNAGEPPATWPMLLHIKKH